MFDTSKIALIVAQESDKLLAMHSNEERSAYLAPKVGGLVDDLVDFRVILGGIPGVIVEQFDGAIAEAITAAVLQRFVFASWPEVAE